MRKSKKYDTTHNPDTRSVLSSIRGAYEYFRILNSLPSINICRIPLLLFLLFFLFLIYTQKCLALAKSRCQRKLFAMSNRYWQRKSDIKSAISIEIEERENEREKERKNERNRERENKKKKCVRRRYLI